MKVENFTGRTGRPVANQFIVTGEHYGQEGKFFQSYKSVILFIPANGSAVSIDRNYWDYSPTTSKYRNQILSETKAETQKKIDSGEYILTDLN